MNFSNCPEYFANGIRGKTFLFAMRVSVGKWKCPVFSTPSNHISPSTSSLSSVPVFFFCSVDWVSLDGGKSFYRYSFFEYSRGRKWEVIYAYIDVICIYKLSKRTIEVGGKWDGRGDVRKVAA